MGRTAHNVHHKQREWGSVHNIRHNELEWGGKVHNIHHTQLELGSVHNVHHTQLEWATQYIKNIANIMTGPQHKMDIKQK